ncbi:MAG: hypothetical protein KDI36_10715, partial [Pseudomonadales bacterium]|nr:hypothetical protein [Pseudomonadales bacterium]
LVFLLVGSFPVMALFLPKSVDLDMEKPPVAFSCGILVTTAQMLAGASGPVLDIFYIKSSLTRHEILGTKAITQTLGHILKLIYYAFFISAATALPWYVFPAVIVAAIAGNWVGSKIVERIDDNQFKLLGRRIILLIALIYIGKGIAEYIG